MTVVFGHGFFLIIISCGSKAYFSRFFSAKHLEMTLCINLFVLTFFLPEVQIIRDNHISALNHCDLVYAESIACPTALLSFSSFLSCFVCISITNAATLPNHGQMRRK